MSQTPTVKWGDPGKQVGIPRPFRALLEETLGDDLEKVSPYPAPGDVTIPPSQLTPAIREKLEALLGPAHVQSDHPVRLRHAHGKSYLDIVRYCSGKLNAAPDAVLFPENREQVMAILCLASEQNLPVIPFGGGTSVVGGVDPVNNGLTLSLERMNQVLDIDEVSGTVTAEAGILGPELEEALNAHDLTLGHFPQSFEYSTVGGWIASRSAGQQSNLYGKIENLLLSLEVATPAGELKTLAVPAAATGPDLDQVFCGSEGTLGVITEATFRLRRLPESRIFTCGLFPSFAEGIEALREVMQKGLRPATVRLFDESETAVLGTLRGTPLNKARRVRKWLEKLVVRAQGMKQDSISLLILSFEGFRSLASHQAQDATRLIALRKGMALGPAMGRRWYQTRFELPYLRDPLIQRGLLIDTLETAVPWCKLGTLHADVQAAIASTISRGDDRNLVLTHLSHAYPDGASLYFTFLARAELGNEVEQWKKVQHQVMQVIMQQGAAISHHHGIGRYHQDYFCQQAGENHLKVLRSIKNALDPRGIMNPGKLGLSADG